MPNKKIGIFFFVLLFFTYNLESRINYLRNGLKNINKYLDTFETKSINITILPFKSTNIINKKVSLKIQEDLKQYLIEKKNVNYINYNFILQKFKIKQSTEIPEEFRNNLLAIKIDIKEYKKGVYNIIYELILLKTFASIIFDSIKISDEKLFLDEYLVTVPKLKYSSEINFIFEKIYYREKTSGIVGESSSYTSLLNFNIFLENIFMEDLFLSTKIFFPFHSLKSKEIWTSEGEEIQANNLKHKRDRVYFTMGYNLYKKYIAIYSGLKLFLVSQIRNKFYISTDDVIISPYEDVTEKVDSKFITLGFNGKFDLKKYYSIFYDFSGDYAIDVEVENSQFPDLKISDVSGFGISLILGLQNNIFNFLYLRQGIELFYQKWEGSGWQNYKYTTMVKWPENYSFSISYFIGNYIDFTAEKFNNFKRVNQVRNLYLITGGLGVIIGGIFNYIGIYYHNKATQTYNKYKDANNNEDALSLGNKMEEYYEKSENYYTTAYQLYIIGGIFAVDALVIELFKNKINRLDVAFVIKPNSILLNSYYRF